MDDFTTIYEEPENPKNIFARKRHLICNTCGKRVEHGLVSVSSHWASCSGKEFSEAFMKMAVKKNGKLTVEDIDTIKNKIAR